jgi:type III pantothenate kinase
MNCKKFLIPFTHPLFKVSLKIMNFVADFGNTRIKAALFLHSELTASKIYNSAEELISDSAFYQKATRAIIGTVTDNHEETEKILGQKIPTLLFRHDTPIPVKNLYKSASTLGSDRLAASIGAWSLFPNRNVLTIDAGTCIKYNFVNAYNEYIGGAISPGLNMRLKAMQHFTSRLPYIEPNANYDKLTGTNTEESLLSGALLGAAAEAEDFISQYRQLHENLQVVFTGGDSAYLCKQLKNRFFAHPHLVLLGLNTVLNFNIGK